MSATYGGMYDWAVRNDSGAALAPFKPFKIDDWVYLDGEVVLVGKAAADDGPHGVVGPISIPAGKLGACAFPGAHWAKTKGTQPNGTTVGPESGEAELTENGQGFITVGTEDARGLSLVAVRGGGGTTAAKNKRALIFGNVPPAAFNAGAQEIVFGVSTQIIAIVMKWGTSARLVADPDYQPMRCVNTTSLSGVYATPTEPVAMVGSIETVEGLESFVLDPFDMYTLEGNELGTAPEQGAPDDPFLKIPYKPGGSRRYRVDSEDCSA